MLHLEFSLIVHVGLFALVLGHGRLIDPASRNAAWRYDFKNPAHYTDYE